MDLTRDITYRGFVLNDENIEDSITGGGGITTGISGCVVDSCDLGSPDAVQFSEKRSQGDGMDAGDVFLGGRHIRMAGTLYGTLRALLYDDLATLRAALNPVLAQRESPGDYGYLPLYFSWPTNRASDYPSGAIDLMVKAMPRSISTMFDRDQSGGGDGDSLAIPWQATFVCRDPTILGASPQDYSLTAQTEVTGATATASTNLIGKASHGLIAQDRVRITTLGTGGAGLLTTVTYYVSATGLTSSAFAVSLTSGGAVIDITSDSTGLKYVKSSTTSGNTVNRGTYLGQVNALFYVGYASGTITATIGDTIFTITVPASTISRIIRINGEEKVCTVEDDTAGTGVGDGNEVPHMDYITFTNDQWPLIDSGTQAYSVTTAGCILRTGSHFWFYERYA